METGKEEDQENYKSTEGIIYGQELVPFLFFLLMLGVEWRCLHQDYCVLLNPWMVKVMLVLLQALLFETDAQRFHGSRHT